MAVVNTTLEVGMLSVPVGLNKVAESKDVKIDRASQNGNKIKRVERDELTSEVVESDDVQRGVFADDGFKPIPADALEEIELATKIDTFAIEEFVSLEDVPFERATSCYFIAPQKGVNAKPLRILYEALKASGKAGVFKFVLRSRQHAAVLYAQNGGLYVNTLVWAEDWTRAKRAQESLDGIEVDPKMVALAVDLIDNMTEGREAIDALTDDLRPLKQQLVDDALAGRKVKAPEKKKVAVADAGDALEQALRASLAESGKKKAANKPAKDSRKVAAAAK